MARKKRETFGQLVTNACERQGVSHRELARRLGVAQSRVPEIVRSPSLTEALLVRIAAALELDLELRFVKRRKR
jgi:plasmid maintenance system antidote protein VapI